ncbi:MAG: hypothetical protein ABII03_04265 [Nanoarchaeota archaeon]
MGDKYTIGFINEKLKPYDARLIKGKVSRLEYEGKKTPILVTSSGMVDEDSVDRIARELSEGKKEKQTKIFSQLTKPYHIKGTELKQSNLKKLEDKLGYAIFVLSIGLVTLILSKTTLTGFAINNIPNTTSNIGILVCVVGILGLMYWKFKNK